MSWSTDGPTGIGEWLIFPLLQLVSTPFFAVVLVLTSLMPLAGSGHLEEGGPPVWQGRRSRSMSRFDSGFSALLLGLIAGSPFAGVARAEEGKESYVVAQFARRTIYHSPQTPATPAGSACGACPTA